MIESEEFSTQPKNALLHEVVHIAENYGWGVAQLTEFRLDIFIEGLWHNYKFAVYCPQAADSLRLSCEFSVAVSTAKEPEILRLLHLINEQSKAGFFSYMADRKAIIYHYGFMCDAQFQPARLRQLFLDSLKEAEQFISAFQLVHLNQKGAALGLKLVQSGIHAKAFAHV